MAPSRSRSPKRASVNEEAIVPAKDDVMAAHRLRTSYAPPRQSKFRVAAILRFVRPDGTAGVIEAVNAEPGDANIRGAICAERIAMGIFQKDEAALGSRIVRVVCATDCKSAIFPGPLCREFLTASCQPDVEVIATGSDEAWVAQPLRELLPLPSLYRLRDQDSMKAVGAELGSKVVAPTDEKMALAYEEAVAYARAQLPQAAIFPVLFAAAVVFSDGRVHSACELKGIEYGCTVDAVSLLLTEMIKARKAGKPAPVVIVQADNFGLAHAPFAGARSLLVEHGFGSVTVCGHNDGGKWAAPITALESLPHANFMDIF